MNNETLLFAESHFNTLEITIEITIEDECKSQEKFRTALP